MKKGDLVILSVVILSACIAFSVFFSLKKGERVVVTKNNKVVYEQTLSKDSELDLGSNILEIKNKKVKMLSADCKNQICVKHKEIEKKGERIVCLPNKIIVEIK